MDRAAVVIATHRYEPGLQRCLSSVLPLLRTGEDLIFVDNGSGQNLGSWVSDHYPRTTILTLDRNNLFCGGYNAGIRLALTQGYEFVLILNADTEVIAPNFLPRLLEAAHRRPRAAFIGPLVYHRTAGIVQRTCLSFPSVLRHALTWFPWRVHKKHFERQPARESEVEFLNGVCVLCRTAALAEIGLMDEIFGGYVEDADWSWRARKKGWASLFVPIPSIVHHEEPTGYEPYSLKTFLLKRNTVLWYLKVGRRTSALGYAAAALSLAWVRTALARSRKERMEYRSFADKLCKVYLGLLSRKAIGNWFGPPAGAWTGNIIAEKRG